MKIDEHTKISEIIRHHPGVIDAIASLSSHFQKLRNPILRKVLAPRVSLADAAKIGQCQMAQIFEVLKPLGFEAEASTPNVQNAQPTSQNSPPPQMMALIGAGKIKSLDVRPVINGGQDPFNEIMRVTEKLPKNFVLELVNSFEPVPLIKILKSKGYDSWVKNEGEIVKTYFLKTNQDLSASIDKIVLKQVSLAELLQEKARFENSCKEIDVRDLEMPMPMVTILGEVENLKLDHALFVHHKKIPQYLLPELAQRGLKTWAAVVDSANVKLLIHH